MSTDLLFGHGIIREIEAASGAMPEALERIGRYILEQPEIAARVSMADLASHSGSSEASIVRFCKLMGYEGFRDFRIALASDIAYQRNALAPGEAPTLASRVSSAISSTEDEMPARQLKRVATRLLASSHIDIFASGLSGHVADIFAYRFSRLGLVARSFHDPVVMDEVFSAIRKTSVFMTISETGLTAYTERFLSKAKQAGAFSIAVSGRQLSRLSDISDVVLVATPLSPLPARGDTSPVLAKIFLCELIAQEVVRQRERL